MTPTEKLLLVQAAMQCLSNAETAIQNGMDASIYDYDIHMAFRQLKALDKDASKDPFIHDLDDIVPPDADSGFSLFSELR
jgi:hypothetical protein